MPCFRIDPNLIHDGRVMISGETAHHLLRALRVQVGEVVRLTDGKGCCWSGVVAALKRRELIVTLGEKENAPLPAQRITLAAALLPQERWRIVLEKAVELGAVTIQPVITERTQVRSADAKKIERWQAIAESAAEQCGTPWWPTVEPPRRFADIVQEAPQQAQMVICAIGAASHKAPSAPEGAIVLLVGPEGGFTPGEVEQAIAAGAQCIGLGPLTLRAETAALVGLALLQHKRPETD